MPLCSNKGLIRVPTSLVLIKIKFQKPMGPSNSDYWYWSTFMTYCHINKWYRALSICRLCLSQLQSSFILGSITFETRTMSAARTTLLELHLVPTSSDSMFSVVKWLLVLPVVELVTVYSHATVAWFVSLRVGWLWVILHLVWKVRVVLSANVLIPKK